MAHCRMDDGLSTRCPYGLGKKAVKRVSGDVAGGPVSLCRVRLGETRRGALCSVLTGGGTCAPLQYTPLTTACGGPPATESGPLSLLRPCGPVQPSLHALAHTTASSRPRPRHLHFVLVLASTCRPACLASGLDTTTLMTTTT